MVSLPRAIPVLLLQGVKLVKTVKFRSPTYLGDPRNVVRIFNDKEVDELVVLDINATPKGTTPDFDLVEEIVSEAFMPVAYGGGIRTLEDAAEMFRRGIEKIVINSHAIDDPGFVSAAAAEFGSQSVVVSLDVRRGRFGRYTLYTHGGRKKRPDDVFEAAVRAAQDGAGELVINSIDRDGTMEGYDLELIRTVVERVNVPVIACGGAGSVDDLGRAVRGAGAAAAAAGSMFVFQGPHRAVLISYPDRDSLQQSFFG